MENFVLSIENARSTSQTCAGDRTAWKEWEKVDVQGMERDVHFETIKGAKSCSFIGDIYESRPALSLTRYFRSSH